jgi:outer membrane lipase/esterase
MKNVIHLMIVAGALLAAGTAKAQVQVPYFGQYYGFGDSLTDNGRVLRETGYNPSAVVGPLLFGGPGFYENGQWSNLPGFFELVPAKIGVPYVPQNDFAVGGAASVHQAPNALLSPLFSWGLPDQIDTFVARGGHFAPNDLINLWIGTNDLGGISPAATSAAKLTAVQGIINNTTDAVSKLASLGASVYRFQFGDLSRNKFRQRSYNEFPLTGGSGAAQCERTQHPLF